MRELLKANAYWIIPLLSLLLTGVVANVANALLKYPATETLGHAILDRLSLLTRSDSPGTLKMLGKRSRKPGN